jgi:hypothetical protein
LRDIVTLTTSLTAASNGLGPTKAGRAGASVPTVEYFCVVEGDPAARTTELHAAPLGGGEGSLGALRDRTGCGVCYIEPIEGKTK